MKRILVTGSRDWDDEDTIFMVLAYYAETFGKDNVLLVHGDCPTGADAIAHRFWHTLWGLPVETHPADWRMHGKAAGPIRNAEMAALPNDVCLAFIKNNSKGATSCADLAENTGTLVRRFRPDAGP